MRRTEIDSLWPVVSVNYIVYRHLPMKWLPIPKQSPRYNKENSSSPRPFLVLPRVSNSLMTGGTWPPPPRRPHARRPSTATLERPVLLDIGLLDKLDMSLVRKEFLCITNLCRSPISRVSSLPASPRVKIKKLETKGENNFDCFD